MQLALLDRMIDGCAADLLVLEDPEAARSKRKARMRYLLRLFAQHATKRSVRVVKVARADVHDVWAARGMTTKEATAAAIGELLPALRHLVPTQRSERTKRNE